jgi:hypothetical protein
VTRSVGTACQPGTRSGEDLVTVAELAGRSRLETLRIYNRPTDDDRHNALRHLTVDR